MAKPSPRSTAPLWASSEGPLMDFAVSTRIRLARNIEGYSFCHLLAENDREKLWRRLRDGLSHKDEFADFHFAALSRMPKRERMMLIEQHLLSLDLEHPSRGTGVILDGQKDVSILVNEEDHLRIQVILPGLQLEQAWATAESLDARIEEVATVSFHSDLGYLTVCPSNVGTGLRISVMLHLPALTLNGQMGNLIGTLFHNDVMVRGFYGEGTRINGSIYQLSNQKTLGRSETDILEDMRRIVMQVIEKERTARKILLSENRSGVENDVRRSLGTLLYASRVCFEEALELLSAVRLGCETGILDAKVVDFNLALTVLGDAHLQKAGRGDLSEEEIEQRRADLLRTFVRGNLSEVP